MTKTEKRRIASAAARRVAGMTRAQMSTWYKKHVGYDVVEDAAASASFAGRPGEITRYCRAMVASQMFFEKMPHGVDEPRAEEIGLELEQTVMAGKRSLARGGGRRRPRPAHDRPIEADEEQRASSASGRSA